MNTIQKIIDHVREKGTVGRTDFNRRSKFPKGKYHALKVAGRLEEAGVLEAITTTRKGKSVRWRLPRKLEENIRWQQKDEAARFDAKVRTTRSNDSLVGVTVATNQVARDGMVLEISGLDLSNYKRNPVVLWNHGEDPTRGGVPIGTTERLMKRNGKLLASVRFAKDRFSGGIQRKVENGVVNAASIGWNTIEADRRAKPPRITRSEMTEFSFVPVGADTNALTNDHATAEVLA